MPLQSLTQNSTFVKNNNSMKILLSPAKSLNLEAKIPAQNYTQPVFLNEAERIEKILKKKSVKSLEKLLHISTALAQLNYQRNQEWETPFTLENARQAMYTFNGEVYRGFDTYSLPQKKITLLQNSIRIVSGLYGILKPLDLIQAYRLEMGTKLTIGKSKNLYSFWTTKITKHLQNELQPNEVLVNLASNEYAKAIDFKSINNPKVTPVFKDLKNGEYKTIMTFAKLARGYMSRYIIDTNAQTADDLKGFHYQGYAYSENLSTEERLVFIR